MYLLIAGVYDLVDTAGPRIKMTAGPQIGVAQIGIYDLRRDSCLVRGSPGTSVAIAW